MSRRTAWSRRAGGTRGDHDGAVAVQLVQSDPTLSHPLWPLTTTGPDHVLRDAKVNAIDIDANARVEPVRVKLNVESIRRN